MIIKRYLVKNMNEAMTRIRYELGKDAIIISQRKVREPGLKGYFAPKLIEVTAALENNKEKAQPTKNSESEIFKESLNSIKKLMENENVVVDEPKVIEQKVNTKSELKNSALEEEVKEMKELLGKILKNTEVESQEDEILTRLKELDISNDYIDELVDIYNNSKESVEDLKSHIHSSIGINTEEINGRVVLVGPTGVGKTTTIAKLAGKLSLVDKKKVGLITIDTYRIGAVEQLKTYAEIMNIPFKVVITIKEMEEAIDEMKDLDVVLIDTTGRSSKNAMQISELRAFVQKAEPDETLMVVSATTKNRDIKEILNGYGEIGFDKIIITKLDETSTYGPLYTVIKESQKPIGYITVGQNVPADIRKPTKNELVKLILGEEVTW